MVTIARSPAKGTFNLRSIAMAVILLSVITASLGWAFTRLATPKPSGSAAVPMPSHSGGRPPTGVPAPAQPIPFNPQPAPIPVPTPPEQSSLSSAGLRTGEVTATPAVSNPPWGLTLAMLLGVALGLRLRRAAGFQPSAFGR